MIVLQQLQKNPMHLSDSFNAEKGGAQPSHDSSTAAKLLADATEFAVNLKDSFLYSAIQSPITGISQICDQLSGTHLTEKTHFIDAPAQAQFGSAAWHAQQIGSGLGMAADFLVANKFVGGTASKIAGQTAELSTLSNFSASSTAAIGRSAFTGALFQGLFTPSQGSGRDFWLGRLENAGSGALTFGALTGASLGLRSMLGTATAESALLTRAIKSDAAIGTLAGIPAGAVSAESNSLLHGKGLASTSDVMQSAYGFVVAGGPLGLLHGLGMPESSEKPEPKAEPETKTKTESETETKAQTVPGPVRPAAAESTESRPDLKIAASDHTNTHWDSLKLEWKVFDKLDIKPDKIDLTRDAHDQIESVRREDVAIKRRGPGSDESVDVTVPCIVFKLAGRATEIVVPEAGWKNLDLARDWRKFAADMTPEDKAQFDQLMKRSQVDAYFKAVLPEQLGMLLDELPDPSIVKRLVIWPHRTQKAAAD
ncbi:MAG TPA: hypothetical protein V6C72_11705, partial [Chroococcales cyanobacterium]